MKVLHRPLTAPLVAKLAPPVAPQMKMSGSAPGLISIAIMLRIVAWTLSLAGSGRRSVEPATNGSQSVGGCNPRLTCSPTVTCSPKTEPKATVICSPKPDAKVAKKFKRK